MDLIYKQDGMFTRFYPETKAGETAWNEMANQMNGVAAVLNFEAKAVIAQLRAAGYRVSKASKLNVSDDELLAQLTA